MPICIDLNRYMSNELITICELPFQISGMDRIDFTNSTSTLVYFNVPNGEIVGPCQSGCYLRPNETGVPMTRLGSGRRCRIVIVNAGYKVFSVSEKPLTNVYSLEHGIKAQISFQYDVNINYKLQPDKIKRFIEFIIQSHEPSVNQYIEKNIYQLIKQVIDNHASSLTDKFAASTFSDLSNYIVAACNKQSELLHLLNKELTNTFEYYTAELNTVTISCPQLQSIINQANTIPSVSSQGEVQTLQADTARRIKFQDDEQELRIEAERTKIRIAEKAAETQLEIIRQQSEIYARAIEAMSAAGLEAPAILSVIENRPQIGDININLQALDYNDDDSNN